MVSKNTIFVVAIAVILTALYFYYGRVQAIDPQLQKQIEANIPECAARDQAGEEMKKRMKEQNRTYYFGDELDDYDRKAKACFNKFVKTVQENKQLLNKL